jgi:hypothetical protein
MSYVLLAPISRLTAERSLAAKGAVPAPTASAFIPGIALVWRRAGNAEPGLVARVPGGDQELERVGTADPLLS